MVDGQIIRRENGAGSDRRVDGKAVHPTVKHRRRKVNRRP